MTNAIQRREMMSARYVAETVAANAGSPASVFGDPLLLIMDANEL
jgi:Na+/H+ antiporter NhaD/arsenite permease-like protein